MATASFDIPVTSISSTAPPPWGDVSEGQLSVDVAETTDAVVVVAPMAGAGIDTIDVFVHNDVLTIRGVRRSPLASEREDLYIHEECFWGRFSRTVVLPCHVKNDLTTAEYRQGVLVVRIPKQSAVSHIPVTIVEE